MSNPKQRLDVLDGWRGISILLVLAGHLLPLGPKRWEMNAPVAASGMSLFFILSGFLIVSSLLADGDVRRFLIHRAMRILPLAWLAMGVMLATMGPDDVGTWAAHFLFYANGGPAWLQSGTAHFWSLCVEVQFYLGVALLVAIGRPRALLLIPLVSLAVTGNRIAHHALIDIQTLLRVDEILAGGTLALAWRHRPGWFARKALGWAPFLGVPLLVLASDTRFGALDYLRPYLAATVIGSTLGAARLPAVARVLESRGLAYVAKISYALYVVHGCLMATWLGTGVDVRTKYLKRPLMFAATFALAHLSTRYYEKYFIGLGRRWGGKPPASRAVPAKLHSS